MNEINLDTMQLPPVKYIECPSHVSALPRAKAEWDRVCKSLSDLGILTSADKPALELYYSSYALFWKCVEDLKKDGMYTHDKYGLL